MRIIFALLCFVFVGCSKPTPKATQEEIVSTLREMNGMVLKVKQGERPSVCDTWGQYIHVDLDKDSLGEVQEDTYKLKYLHSFILPKEAKVKKFLGNNWVTIEIDGKERTEKFEIPIFTRYKANKITLRSSGPDKLKNTEDDIVHVVDCDVTYVTGDIREAGNSIGRMTIVESVK
jgi:hypothetical protein